MRFVPRLDKDDCYESADIRDITPTEMIVLDTALRRYINDENVRAKATDTAREMVRALNEGCKNPSSPLTSI